MIICVPYTPIFESPDAKSQQIDEAVYGMECEITDESGKYYKIKMFYNYEGWIEKNTVCEVLHYPNMIADVPFADLLAEAGNFRAPVMTLPRGSLADVGFSEQSKRYGFVVLPSKRIYYIHKNHVRDINKFFNGENTARDGIASAARSYLGVQYRWGGKTPNGIDCSGLAFMSYYLNGIIIFRDADITRSPNVKKIPFSLAEKGDLLYFKGHMAVYLGGGDYIHASAEEGRVVYGSFNESSAFFNSGLADKLLYTGTIF